MRKTALLIFVAAAAWGAWVYEGQWGSFGSGNGYFDDPEGIAVGANGYVYVADQDNDRVQYFTPTGSYLGKWGSSGPQNGEFSGLFGIAVAPNGNVYAADSGNHRIQYFTPTGSFLGKWGSDGTGNGQFRGLREIAVSSSGTVYAADPTDTTVQYFTATGSYRGRLSYSQMYIPWALAAAPDGVIHVGVYRLIYRFSPAGSYLGYYGWPGSGPGQFGSVDGVDVGPTGYIVTIDSVLNRVTVFNPNGSYLEMWEGTGGGNGQFREPRGVCFNRTGSRIYVVDSNNCRIQYFNRNAPAVEPSSLGRVKAVFR